MGKLKKLLSGHGERADPSNATATRSFADPTASTTADATQKDLLSVPANSSTATPLRPSSHWGQKNAGDSPASIRVVSDNGPQQYVTPMASQVPDRRSSRGFKRATPPSLEQDYDQYRIKLAKGQVTPPSEVEDELHDTNEESPTTAHQQAASREYGRRQIQATEGLDQGMQNMSISDGKVTRSSTDPVSVSDGPSRSSTDPTTMSPGSATARSPVSPVDPSFRKPLPPPKENIAPTYGTTIGSSQPQSLRHKADHPNLQNEAQIQQPPTIPKRQHRYNTSVSSTTPSIPQDGVLTKSTNPDHQPRLPEGFIPGHREDTSVDTSFSPAVTHERKVRQIHEIVTESITRDIHVDHYYHVLQPLKATEVRPAQHIRISSKTGEKLSVAEPAGWSLPGELAVRPAPDISGLQWERRDYVLDEENPTGRDLTPEELERAHRMCSHRSEDQVSSRRKGAAA